MPKRDESAPPTGCHMLDVSTSLDLAATIQTLVLPRFSDRRLRQNSGSPYPPSESKSAHIQQTRMNERTNHQLTNRHNCIGGTGIWPAREVSRCCSWSIGKHLTRRYVPVLGYPTQRLMRVQMPVLMRMLMWMWVRMRMWTPMLIRMPMPMPVLMRMPIPMLILPPFSLFATMMHTAHCVLQYRISRCSIHRTGHTYRWYTTTPWSALRQTDDHVGRFPTSKDVSYHWDARHPRNRYLQRKSVLATVSTMLELQS